MCANCRLYRAAHRLHRSCWMGFLSWNTAGMILAGLAVNNAAGKIEVVKAKGRLRVLSEMTDEGKAVQGSCGIGHTRWATHGEPSVVNAHPHYSRDQKIAVVHNGIIENYQELKTRLINKGFTFASQTDTEVVAQLLDYYYTGVSAGDSLDAITRMMMHVRGSYALGILFADQPGVVYAVRKDSPLIVGKAENGSLIASDVPGSAEIYPHGVLHR